MKAFHNDKDYTDKGRNDTRTTISSASARRIGLVMWSPYCTPTFCASVKREAYLGRLRSERDAAPALTRLVAVRTL